jgi:arsenite/tail-anchored protein-transporting ATPase
MPSSQSNSPSAATPARTPRILLFTGKGGVGKTTTAAATALRCAELGMKTLVLSTDPAHSLGDALDRTLGPEAEEIVPNLFAQELDLYYSMKKEWSNIRALLLQVFRWQGVDSMLAEELSALPGMEEASAFLWLDSYVQSGEFDVIVIDSAPTGETLTLLTLPQTAQWWMTRAFPFQKVAVQTVGAMVRSMTGIPVDTGFMEMDSLFERLQRIQKVMNDPEVTSIRLVMNPERMVIQEAQRAYTYLQLYGFAVDGVVVNRIIPDSESTALFAEYVKAQRGYLQEIETSFAPLPLLLVPHAGKEVFGLELLREIASRLYGTMETNNTGASEESSQKKVTKAAKATTKKTSNNEDDSARSPVVTRNPADFFIRDKTFELRQDGAAYLLRLRVPFVASDAVTVSRRQDEVIVQVNTRRKNLFLPRFLAYYTLAEHRLDAGWLELRFVQ